MKKFLFVLCSTTVLFGACDKKEILPGKRESVEGINESAKFDKEILNSTIRISVTPSTVVSEYKDIAGNKQHKALNYKVAQNPKMLWKTSIGGAQISSEPIAFNGHAYVVNSHGDLVCIELKDGKQKWSLNIAKQPDDASFAGGITAENSVIYASTNIGDVVAVNTTTQKILWKKSLKYPLRGAPLYADGIVIVNSIDGQTFALNALNGSVIWMKKLQGEMTVMSKASTPALFGHSIICAYSSGDLKSYDLRSGGDNWDDVLFSANLSDSGSVMAHIVASPVVSNGNILATTSESGMVMFDASSGVRIWENEIGTINTPLVNSGWIFVLTQTGAVICLSEKDGSIKWVSEVKELLPDQYSKDAEFVGALLINEAVMVFSNTNNIVTLDISTGKIKGITNIDGADTIVAPIVIDGRIIAVNSRAELYAIG